jgi:protein dithiol oxidoreductase (disulfide-forming)
MNRREFSAATGVVLAGAALGLPTASFAQRRPEDGKDYIKLDKQVPVEAPAGKIEVIEFFWYSCPHCNHFEPTLNAWLKSRKPADVAFRRVPVAFRDDFVPQQRLYYTLEAMGKLDELHDKVFDAIHNQHQPTNREDSILAFAEKNGLDRKKFQEMYESFTISAKARRASQLQDEYKVQGVPALGIAGRYYTDGELTGNMDRALQVVEYLVAEVRKGK